MDHADAAVDAREAGPGRESRVFVERRFHGSDMLGFQTAFDVTGDPACALAGTRRDLALVPMGPRAAAR